MSNFFVTTKKRFILEPELGKEQDILCRQLEFMSLIRIIVWGPTVICTQKLSHSLLRRV